MNKLSVALISLLMLASQTINAQAQIDLERSIDSKLRQEYQQNKQRSFKKIKTTSVGPLIGNWTLYDGDDKIISINISAVDKKQKDPYKFYYSISPTPQRNLARSSATLGRYNFFSQYVGLIVDNTMLFSYPVMGSNNSVLVNLNEELTGGTGKLMSLDQHDCETVDKDSVELDPDSSLDNLGSNTYLCDLYAYGLRRDMERTDIELRKDGIDSVNFVSNWAPSGTVDKAAQKILGAIEIKNSQSSYSTDYYFVNFMQNTHQGPEAYLTKYDHTDFSYSISGDLYGYILGDYFVIFAGSGVYSNEISLIHLKKDAKSFSLHSAIANCERTTTSLLKLCSYDSSLDSYIQSKTYKLKQH